MKIAKIALISVTALGICACSSREKTYAERHRNVDWAEIEEYFEVPEEYADDFGEYASPLRKADGTTVKCEREWLERREEIRSEWFRYIGQWPELLTAQDFEVLESDVFEGVERRKVRFYWTPTQQTEGYLLIPRAESAVETEGVETECAVTEGVETESAVTMECAAAEDVETKSTVTKKNAARPAVICVFYEPETAIGLGSKPLRDFAIQLAHRGFITLSIGTSETTRDKTYSLYYPSIENAELQPLSALAYAAANAYEVLARIEEVDSQRIGIVGHSYGGKWAMFASCLYDKFACAAWGDPGIVFDESKGGYINYWEPWYLGYYPLPWDNLWQEKGYEHAKGAYAALRGTNHDLHELHSLMAPRPFLVSGGYSDGPDRWRALNHTVEVNKILGYEKRVAMTNRPTHDPTEESNEAIYRFFELYLMP